EVGGFDEGLHCASDREIWFRIARRHAVAYCRKVALRYRVLANSVTAAHWRSDRFCYEYSRMFGNSFRLWPERQLRGEFRRAFLTNARAFLGSSLRAARRGAWREIPRN